MARPETPIDPRTGPQAAFAVELRQLREFAGLTYRELAQRAHYSQGALCEAARGHRLPSWEVTEAFVAGCEGDQQQWRARWEASAAEIGGDSNTATAPGATSDAVAAPSDSAGVREPLPSGDVPPLSSLTSPQDFHLALRALRSRAGNPSLRGLSVLARKNGGHVLPRSTLADALTGTDHLPSLEIVEAFLSACDVPAAEVHAWRSAWARIAYLLQRNSMPGGTRWQDNCPYLGLAAFTEDQSEVFYGRELITTKLLKQLKGRVRGGAGMLVVTGPSGAGKSSLLRAGLLPALAKGELGPGSQDWPRLVITPGSAPLGELAVHLAGLAGVNSAEVRESLAEHPHTAHLNARQALLARLAQQPESSESRALPGRLVLIVDQFEELFTAVRDKAEREAFITSLCAMAGVGSSTAELPPAIVVLGLRADFFSECTAYPSLAEALESSQVLVGPMTEIELRSAITGPATAAGLIIEAGLVDDVLADLRSTGTAGGFDPGALPLLSQAMLLTWEHREDTALTRHAYVTGGGLRNGIQMSAEAAYRNLTPGQQEAARTLFRRMVTFTDQGQSTRCKIQLSDLELDSSTADDLRAALEEFTNKRLITLSKDTAEIVHEVLLHTWQRLKSWIAQDREWLRLSGELVGAASVWEESGQDPAFLYHGSRLEAAEESVNKTDSTAPPSVQLFLDSSRTHERRGTLKRRGLRTLVVLMAVVALLAGVAAFAQHQAARSLASSRFAADSRFLSAEHPYDSMWTAVEAYQMMKDPETLSALLSAQSQYFAGQFVDQAPLTGHAGTINKVVFSPNGRLLATASEDDTARVWDVASRQSIATLPSPGLVNDVEFSPNGHLLVTAGGKGAARLWDVASHQLIATLPATLDTVFLVANFSPNGHFLATTSENGITQLWDVEKRQSISKLGNQSSIYNVVFSPDGNTVATADANGIVQLWNVTNPLYPTRLGRLPTQINARLLSRPQTSPSNLTPQSPGLPRTNPSRLTQLDGNLPQDNSNDYVKAVVFNHDGTAMATTSEDGTVRLWDVHDPRDPRLATSLANNQPYFINAVVFSPDDTTLAMAGEDGTAQLWDVAARQLVGTLKGHNGPIRSVAFDTNGHTVATAGYDRIVRLWDTGGPILSSPIIGSGIDDIKFSPDGHIVAAVGVDNVARLWDVAAKHTIAKLTDYATNVINAVAFSGDGRLLATIGPDGVARVWDIASQRTTATLPNPTNQITEMVFSPKTRILATIGKDGIAQLWNVTNPFNPARLNPFLTGYTISAVAFSGDGRLLATIGPDRAARVWEIASQRTIATLPNPATSPITKMVFSPDGRSLITASENGAMRRWELATRSFADLPPPPGENLSLVALSPDGGTLATTGSDNAAIQLWDMNRGGELSATLTAHTGHTGHVAVRAAFSPDSRFLITTSNDDTVRLWDLDPDQVIKHLCQIIGSLNKEQFLKLMPGFSYRPTCR